MARQDELFRLLHSPATLEKNKTSGGRSGRRRQHRFLHCISWRAFHSIIPSTLPFIRSDVAVMAARKHGSGPEWPLYAFLRAWMLTSRRLNARWAFADMIAFLRNGEEEEGQVTQPGPAEAKRRSVQTRNCSTPTAGLKQGPSGSALAVCVQLILLAVRGQIETKQ